MALGGLKTFAIKKLCPKDEQKNRRPKPPV